MSVAVAQANQDLLNSKKNFSIRENETMYDNKENKRGVSADAKNHKKCST